MCHMHKTHAGKGHNAHVLHCTNSQNTHAHQTRTYPVPLSIFTQTCIATLLADTFGASLVLNQVAVLVYHVYSSGCADRSEAVQVGFSVNSVCL